MASKALGADLNIDTLVELITKSGKEMFSLCYRKADRKTKIQAMPLLEKMNDLEICAFLLDLFLTGNDEVLKPLSSKLILYNDKVQEELTDLKSKLACNKSGFTNKQIETEHTIFTRGVDEVMEMITSVDKRVTLENTVRRNEEVHSINMDLIHAEVKLLQAFKLSMEAREYLSRMNEARNHTEGKLIDAFEEVIMESESRHLIYAEQEKKKAEAKCVKAEKKHTEVEMGYLKIRDSRRDAFEDYEGVIRKRHNLKVKELLDPEEPSPKLPNKSPRSTPKSKAKKNKGAISPKVSAKDKIAINSPKTRGGLSTVTETRTPPTKPRMSATDKVKSSPKTRGSPLVTPRTVTQRSPKPRTSATDTATN